jgi:hypothetical protein
VNPISASQNTLPFGGIKSNEMNSGTTSTYVLGTTRKMFPPHRNKTNLRENLSVDMLMKHRKYQVIASSTTVSISGSPNKPKLVSE